MTSHSECGKIIECNIDNSSKIVLKKLHINPTVREPDTPVKDVCFVEYKCGSSTEKYKTKAYKITYDSNGVCTTEYLCDTPVTDTKKISDMILQQMPTSNEQ